MTDDLLADMVKPPERTSDCAHFNLLKGRLAEKSTTALARAVWPCCYMLHGVHVNCNCPEERFWTIVSGTYLLAVFTMQMAQRACIDITVNTPNTAPHSPTRLPTSRSAYPNTGNRLY